MGSYKWGYKSPNWVITIVTLLITPLITIVTLLITPLITIVTLLLTPLITTHEPPSTPLPPDLRRPAARDQQR